MISENSSFPSTLYMNTNASRASYRSCTYNPIFSVSLSRQIERVIISVRHDLQLKEFYRAAADFTPPQQPMPQRLAVDVSSTEHHLPLWLHGQQLAMCGSRDYCSLSPRITWDTLLRLLQLYWYRDFKRWQNTINEGCARFVYTLVFATEELPEPPSRRSINPLKMSVRCKKTSIGQSNKTWNCIF